MSLRTIIARHGRAYQVLRRGPGTYDAVGRYVEPAEPPVLMFIAAIQPLSGKQLMALPIGQTAEDTRVAYTTFELKTRGPTQAPDVVLYKGDRWTVFQVSEWEGLSGSPHYVAFIARQTTQASPV